MSSIVEDFTVFLVVGFVAQLIDGALGMAFGVVATTALLSAGVPPAHASAATHLAEVFTTAASAVSHIAFRNVDWRLFLRLAPAGMLGGALGAFVLTAIDGAVIRPFVFAYLGLMGGYIILRFVRTKPPRPVPPSAVPAIGAGGGFVDAIGGGGWGPVVTATLVGAGERPRYVIGTVNTTEFLVAVTISAAFVIALVTGHWRDAGDLSIHAASVAGLVCGGLLAAPFAGYLVQRVPAKPLGIAVGLLILLVSIHQILRML